MIRMLLVDDQALVRGALAALLGLEPDIEVVAETASGEEALRLLKAHAVDVALLDIQLSGGLDGLGLAAVIRDRHPECRVVMCTTFGRPGYLTRAMQAGAAGFAVKDTPPEQLVAGIRKVHAGLRVVDPALAAESLALGTSPLTPREREVLAAVGRGGSVAAVAGRLHLSAGTVRNHLSAAIGKTGARTSVEAARIAEDLGWL